MATTRTGDSDPGESGGLLLRHTPSKQRRAELALPAGTGGHALSCQCARRKHAAHHAASCAATRGARRNDTCRCTKSWKEHDEPSTPCAQSAATLPQTPRGITARIWAPPLLRPGRRPTPSAVRFRQRSAADRPGGARPLLGGGAHPRLAVRVRRVELAVAALPPFGSRAEESRALGLHAAHAAHAATRGAARRRRRRRENRGGSRAAAAR